MYSLNLLGDFTICSLLQSTTQKRRFYGEVNPNISDPKGFCAFVMKLCHLCRRFRLSFAFGVCRPSVVEGPSRHGVGGPPAFKYITI